MFSHDAAQLLMTSYLSDQLSKYESAKGDEDDKLTVSDVDWDKCDDVSIIGAGIAGAYASYRLRDIGKKITIYEYSDRIGGRCYTGKLTGVPDVNVEYGAMRFRPGSRSCVYVCWDGGFTCSDSLESGQHQDNMSV